MTQLHRLYAFAPGGFDVPLPAVTLGLITGITYGLLAVGLVLIYRSNRIINFAHGEIGVFTAALFAVAVTRWKLPYFAAFPLALAFGGGVGGLTEVTIIRRLRKAPRIMSIVATLGAGQFLLVFGLALNSQLRAGSAFPRPPFLPTVELGAFVITPAHTAMLVLAPIVVIALAVFLRKSRTGLAIRSAADDPDVARMSGIYATRMSSLSWAIGGAVSAFTAILVLPSQGFTGAESFGPSLLLRALAGAVIARMNSLPQAFAAGIGVGVVEQLLLWNHPQAGFVELVLFVVILAALLLGRPLQARDDERGSWAAVEAWRAIPEAMQRIWLIRHLGKVVAAICVVLAAALPLVITNGAAVDLVGIMAFAIVGLSVGVIAGLGGQVSLGQFALAGVGAAASVHIASRVGWFPLAFLYAGLAAATMSLVVGLPALRLRGLMLTVTTLSFALVAPAWLFGQTWMFGDGRVPGRPIVFGEALDTGKEYYYFALVVFVLAALLARNIRAGGFGRLLIAIRDNEDAARAFSIRARVVKIQGFLLAGFIAGVGGAVYAHLFGRVSQSTFPAEASVIVVVMSVIGGISILAGPILGALLVNGFPTFVPLDAAGLAANRLGLLVIVLYLPGGLAQLLQPLRDRVVRYIAEHAASPREDAMEPPPMRVPLQTRRRDVARQSSGHVLLGAAGVSKRFGGVTAIDNVDIEVRHGEVLGLIGPNGAGKTTLFEVLSGFTRPDSGRVTFDGRDITRAGPEDRAHLGLIRSFQDAALFPTMTVEDVVELAFERVAPTKLLASAIGLNLGARAKRRQVLAAIERLGLGAYRSKPIRELSTGTRRITELACLIALEPTLLLLDEPAAGIAQKETEALGHLLMDLKHELDLTLVVIEHDIPMIMSISDRVVVMETGRVISAGAPEVVRADPRVVDAYLGGSSVAIERSAGVARTRG